jgi:hypothetical protein
MLVENKKMRAGVLAIGVFLLVIGVVVFWIGYSDLQQYGGLLGEIGQSLSWKSRQNLQFRLQATFIH